MLSPMNSSSQNSANPLIAKVHQLFSRDLALENDDLRRENRILRSKLGAPPGVDGRLHGATARRLDGAKGSEFLHGGRGLGTTVSVSGP